MDNFLLRHACGWRILVLLAAILCVRQGSAAVVAHYRFEGDNFLADSSGNGHDLANTSNATQVDIPSNFLNPIPPVSGVANTKASTVDALGIGSLSALDSDAFTSNTLTIEALIQPTTLGGSTHVIASHHDSVIGERGWYLGINNGNLRTFSSETGGPESQQSNDAFGSIIAGSQYYVATSFTVSSGLGPNGANVFGTMYLRNLTTGGPLLVQAFTSNAAVTTMNNVPGPLAIGSTSTQPDGTSRFGGVIDEVRISNTALAMQDLLVYYPGIPTGVPSYSISVALSQPTVDGSIQSISIVDGANTTVYEPGDYIGARLTAFGGQVVNATRTIADIIMPPNSTAAPVSADRDKLLGDNLIDTAFVNMKSWDVVFDEDLVNQDGPDIIFVDWGSPDTVDITINNVTKDNLSPTTTNAIGSAMGSRTRFQSTQNDVNTLQKLLDATFTQVAATSGNANAYGIDLSDYGFVTGATFSAGTVISFSDGLGIDPAGVFGLLDLSANLDGDFNQDGTVDAADYVVWREGLGTVYGSGDYTLWRENFGKTAGGEGSWFAAQVPEPNAAALIACCCCIFVGRRFLQ